MKLRAAVLPVLVSAALVAGCSRPAAPVPAAKPKQASAAATEQPIAKPAADDAALVDGLLREGVLVNEPDGRVRPTSETTTLANLTEARKAFGGMLVPHDTLGRRLVAIVYRHALSAGTQPPQMLFLVYEGQLMVSEGAAVRYRHPIFENPTREATTLAGVAGTVETFNGQTIATWDANGMRYRIAAPGISKADAVRVARSMAP